MTEASYKVPKNITAPSPLAPAESESSIANSDSEALDINAGDYEDLPEKGNPTICKWWLLRTQRMTG
jgi:hypothetical protein